MTTKPLSEFVFRHIGSTEQQLEEMAVFLGFDGVDSVMDSVLPPGIRHKVQFDLPDGASETQTLSEMAALASKNQVFESLIGMGYSDVITPPVILRNILENPGWYTQYTPYQAEISQGRLEALLNFQTLVADLTGLPVANASLLDESTACGEAMTMMRAIAEKNPAQTFLLDEGCHPQTIGVVLTRAKPLGIEVKVTDPLTHDFAKDPVFGVLLAYPRTDGQVVDWKTTAHKAKAAGAMVTVTSDVMALLMLEAPGKWGADIVVGTAQRFGVPLGFGGPYAAFISCKDEHKRKLPGRIVGVSKDALGAPAIRLALQTREQHIRREKATSNICTAQVLLAVVASMYAVYHGPEGLKEIAARIHGLTGLMAAGLQGLGAKLSHAHFFDTLKVEMSSNEVKKILTAAQEKRINLREYKDGVGISFDEASTMKSVTTLLGVFSSILKSDCKDVAALKSIHGIPSSLTRASDYLKDPVFNTHHSETEMLRYIRKLESRDLSLTTSMIPLGSCTMKLNATAEMLPITWPGFSRMHPFAPESQTLGYLELTQVLNRWLASITGFDAVSLQPNAGSQGEYSGLLVIHEYHRQKGEGHRNICLIPASAHGTNPATATLAGLKVVVVKCDRHGNIDFDDLQAKAREHAANLSCLMVTYPSTHGVFESSIKDVCAAIHENGGQVYLDGANMNAQVGFCRPGDYGADVCHLNLHKTFCIPHGGGGPGMGPICVKSHLAPFLPGHPILQNSSDALGPVSSAPYGSASILPIPYAYIRLMGDEGLKKATIAAIMNANYIARRLDEHYPVLYRAKNGLVAHECIVDLRHLKASAGIEVEDVAKRLMDYGFHAPTVSFPVPGTLMIEPTESEAREELDRFCDAMILIRDEIRKVEKGEWDRKNNPVKNAPHTAPMIASDSWDKPYSRMTAAYPAVWLKDHKYWPYVARIDSAYGDRNLVCTCPSDWNEV